MLFATRGFQLQEIDIRCGPLRDIEFHQDYDLTITTLPQSFTHLLPFERSRFDKGHGLFISAVSTKDLFSGIWGGGTEMKGWTNTQWEVRYD